MGTHVFGLITRWEPMVDDYRATGSFDFYWDANVRQNDMLSAAQAAGTPFDLDALPELLPYAYEHRFFGGFGHIAAEWYHAALRHRLPPHLREPLTMWVRSLYGEDGARDCDDLAADSGMRGDRSVLYALRPSSVRTALERFGAVPWEELEEFAGRLELPEMAEDRYVPDFGAFEAMLWQQREWLSDAAERDRGVVAVVSR